MGFLNGRVTFTRYRVGGPSPAPLLGGDARAARSARDRQAHPGRPDRRREHRLGGRRARPRPDVRPRQELHQRRAPRRDPDRHRQDPRHAAPRLHPDRARRPGRNEPQRPSDQGPAPGSQGGRPARAEAEAADGRFRRHNHYPILWDGQTGVLYAGTTSSTVLERLMGLFRETFDRPLEPITAGSLAVGFDESGDEADRTVQRLGEGSLNLYGGDSGDAPFDRRLGRERAQHARPPGQRVPRLALAPAPERQRHRAAGRRLGSGRDARQDADPRLPSRRDRPRQPHRRRPDPASRSLPRPPVGQAARARPA